MTASRATFPQEEALQSLLQAILGRLRRFRDTPLRFGIDSKGIAAAAWTDFLNSLPEEDRTRWENQEATASSLTWHVRYLLSNSPVASECPPQSLADWVEQFYCALREADDRSVEIMELRADGFHDRDIAAQLDLGLRLVRQILHLIEINWNHTVETT